jgi:hypothetical protein
LGFGFVSAQFGFPSPPQVSGPRSVVRFAKRGQAAAGMLLRQSLANIQKSSLKTATLFLKTLYVPVKVKNRYLRSQPTPDERICHDDTTRSH